MNLCHCSLGLCIDCLDFYTQITGKYSTAMCYLDPAISPMSNARWLATVVNHWDLKNDFFAHLVNIFNLVDTFHLVDFYIEGILWYTALFQLQGKVVQNNLCSKSWPPWQHHYQDDDCEMFWKVYFRRTWDQNMYQEKKNWLW